MGEQLKNVEREKERRLEANAEAPDCSAKQGANTW